MPIYKVHQNLDIKTERTASLNTMQMDDNKIPEHMKEMVRLDEAEGLLKSSFRTLALFEYFADVRKPMTLSEICLGLNIPQSSGSSLVKSLLDSGFLLKNDTDRTYSPSLRLSFLSNWIDAQNPVQSSLSATAKTLQAAVGETVIIAMRNGLYSQYVFADHKDKKSDHVKTGSLRPLVCSATGWALLLHESDAEIGKLIRRTRAETDNPYWQNTARNALEHIKKSRDENYAYASGPAAEGTAGIAIRINDTNNGPLAIGVAGSTQNIESKKALILENILKIDRG